MMSPLCFLQWQGRWVPVLRFRNLAVSPQDPVELWGTEGILTAFERGTIFHWMRVVAAAKSPKVAEEIKEALALCSRSATKKWVQLQIERLDMTPEQKVAQKLGVLRARSGLTRQEFAKQLGTSGSRFSTYLSGKVTPSAVFMAMAEQLADDRSGLVIRKK